MTPNELVNIVFALCTAASSVKEEQLTCMENQVNCAVKSTGAILSAKEMLLKCVKENKNEAKD